MILDAIDIGGGGILVDLPVQVRDVLMFQHGSYCRVIFRIAGVDVPIDLDPQHAHALSRVVAKAGPPSVSVRITVTPSGENDANR